jgi:hypothetical protein
LARNLVSNAAHHFVKHCRKRELIIENGVATGVFPSAFALRPADDKNPEERWLSGQYLEFYDGTPAEQLCACCHFIPLEMKKSDALCRMKVGEIKQQGEKRSKSLRVFHQPDKDSPAGYAGVHGIPKWSDPPDDELLSLLAALAASDLVRVETAL